MNTTNSPIPSGKESFEIPPPQISTVGANNHRKRRSKLPRQSDLAAAPSSSKPKGSKKPDPTAAKITRPCSECGKRFWSWKALFGHMRCHPERQWRGINPPPDVRRVPETLQHQAEFTDEEHDIATCLVMLANGAECGLREPSGEAQGADCGAFECISCKRVFGSHQALGGHRASHKNVKGCFAITRNEGEIDGCSEDGGGGDGPDGLDVAVGEGKIEGSTGEKMVMGMGHHQCSVCMRVFSSGQALGGHKRCHWEKEEHCVIGSTTKGCIVDLNLPAPPEDVCSSSNSNPGLVLDLRLGI